MSAAGNLTGRVHGGPDALGVPRHDFSTNSNACGPCPLVQQALLRVDATAYPDPDYQALRAALAHWHGVAPERVLMAASASEFIYRISAWVAQRNRTPHAGQGGDAPGVWLPAHHYGDYAAAAQAWGLRPVHSLTQAALAWACDPSSPLGGAQEALVDLVNPQAPELVGVLDRAYEPLRLDGALALDSLQCDRLWQLWTPNKALGLTGVRAAYVIAPPGQAEAVAALERLSPSWPVGAHGVALLNAWVRPDVQAWLQASRVTLRGWRRRQLALCQGLGWRCQPSQTNFFCADTGLDVAVLSQTLAALREQGIKLRDAASFGLPGWVRLGVLPPDSQDALVQAWVAAMHSSGVSTAMGAPV